MTKKWPSFLRDCLVETVDSKARMTSRQWQFADQNLLFSSRKDNCGCRKWSYHETLLAGITDLGDPRGRLDAPTWIELNTDHEQNYYRAPRFHSQPQMSRYDSIGFHRSRCLLFVSWWYSYCKEQRLHQIGDIYKKSWTAW